MHRITVLESSLDADMVQGYISLAQANFHNSSSAIRYGQDCYDERMQVIRKVYVTLDSFIALILLTRIHCE